MLSLITSFYYSLLTLSVKKNFENLSAFGEVMDKSIYSVTLFPTRCIGLSLKCLCMNVTAVKEYPTDNPHAAHLTVVNDRTNKNSSKPISIAF